MNVRRVVLFVFSIMISLVLLRTTAYAQATHHHPRTINQRLKRQHQRIVNGLRHKTMTYQQGSKLSARDRRIHRQEAIDRRHHGGHLTTGERRHLNGALNHTSKQIWHAKHHH